MPGIYILIIYWMIDLAQTAEQFFIFYLICFLAGLNGNSLGLLLGSLITDAKTASTSVMILVIPFVLLAGIFKNLDNFPAWIGWTTNLSPFKFGYEAMVQNEVKYRASLINNLSIHEGMWEAIGYLFALACGYRLLSLIFLVVMRTKVQ